MSVQQRLDRLERQNRWLKRLGALAIAVGAVVVLGAQAKEEDPRHVVVRSLTVEDENGVVRATLKALNTGEVALTLLDKREEIRAAFAVRADGSPTLSLTGKNMTGGALLETAEDGARGLVLLDKSTNARAALTLSAEGSPRLGTVRK